MATANLSVESKDFTLPVVEATAGADGIVVSTLRNDGWVTLDPGFLTTAQCESKITYIDGKNSILRYRGYPIEQLCEQSDFLEVAWLLRHGELPNQEQYDRFISDINHRTMVGEDFRTFMGSFPRTAHPMSVMASAVNALATFYPDTTDINDSDQLDEAATIIMAKARTIVSYIFRRRRDEPMLYPDYSRGYVDDFLRMCFAVPYEPFDSDPLYVHALGRLLIIHADHEQNCSTSVVRIAGSAHANLYSAVAAGINALSGPLHGGANEAVLRQLKAIRDSGKTVKEFVEDAKTSGQRISRTRPPRVQVVRSACRDRQEVSAEDHGTRGHVEIACRRACAVRRRHGIGENRAERRVFRVASPVSECRLLHRIDLPCDRVRSVHVHHIVCIGAYSRLDRAVS